MSERLVNILLDSFGKILLPGLTMTIPLTLISFSIALVIAVFVAMIQVANVRVLKQIARLYVWVIRGTPLLVQLFVVFYGLPGIGVLLDPFPAAVIVFSLNAGAYDSETMRASIESVSKGQMEAGYCVGMRYGQIMQRIVARTYEPLALYIEVGLVYLLFSTVLTWLQRLGEKKLSQYG